MITDFGRVVFAGHKTLLKTSPGQFEASQRTLQGRVGKRQKGLGWKAQLFSCSFTCMLQKKGFGACGVPAPLLSLAASNKLRNYSNYLTVPVAKGLYHHRVTGHLGLLCRPCCRQGV